MTKILIIGAGQAGLATGYQLRRAGHEVRLLDGRARVGDSWRERWDSLRLFTSARHSSLPGLAFPAPGNHYPARDEVADYLATYAKHFELPVEQDAQVRSLRRTSDGFVAVTDRGTHHAPAVVVATGPFHTPFVPKMHRQIPSLHSSDYRSPESLPDGPALVVGGGNSGVQIAAELAASRPVTISLGKPQPVMPQRILGSDVFSWLNALGIVRAPVTGRLGQRVQARDPLIGVGPRGLRRRGVRVVDRIVETTGPTLRTAQGEQVTPSVVIWATGYRPDHSWIQVPGALAGSRPVHEGGISPVSGLYYVGLPFQRSRGSALLGWVGEDAAQVAQHCHTFLTGRE